MKLYGLIAYFKADKVKMLASSYDLSSFGFFQRSGAQEFMSFTGSLLVERTRPNERASVKEQEYLCHVFVRSDSLGGVIIADTEYPSRVAFTLLNKALEDYSQDFPASSWNVDHSNMAYPVFDEHLRKYQNPREADAMMRVQSELDETKIVLHNTMEAILQRGEKLDDLVEKSEGLSMQSKAFYKTAKKTNSCCSIQ